MWTPDQITNETVAIGAIVGAITTVIIALKNNRAANTNLANSVPADLAHRMVSNANQQAMNNQSNQSKSGGVDLTIKPPASMEVTEKQSDAS
jgi:gas vesicle protein